MFFGDTVDTIADTVFTKDMTNTPRINCTSDHFGKCHLHGIPCCAVCCKHENECDFGQCNQPAVECIPCYNLGGQIVEQRPACNQHATYGPKGVGYDLKAERRANERKAIIEASKAKREAAREARKADRLGVVA